MNRQAILERYRRQMPIIAPSMLKCDFGNLQREVELLESAGTSVLHLDVMDGHFVPNLSYGPMVIERLRETTSLPFDAHLMISEPGRYLDDYLEAGCDGVTFHIEAEPDAVPLLRRIRSADAVAGLALNPGTPVDKIEGVLNECDLVLVMSVEPGFGGQAFQPVALEKLKQLRQLMPESAILAVDGGISGETIEQAAHAGAGFFVVGSAIFNTNDYKAAINELTSLASPARKPTPAAEV